MLNIELTEEENKKLDEINELFSELKTETGLIFASGSMIYFLQRLKENTHDKLTFLAVKNGMCDFIKNYETLNENKS